MSGPTHIASLLVHANPDHRSEIETGIKEKPSAEIALSDESGRIIVTLETPSEAEIVQALTEIQLLTGVVSASLVYHQTDYEPGTPASGAHGGVS